MELLDIAKLWGVNVISLPFTASALTGKTEQLRQLILEAEKKGIYAILTPYSARGEYNDLRYPNNEVLSAIEHLAEEFALHNNAMFDIWNEPYDVEWSELYPVIEKAIEIVRAVNRDAIVVVPGTKWSRDFQYISYQPLADAQLVYRVNYDPWLIWTPDDSSYSQLIDPYPWWSNLLGKYPILFGEFKFLQVPSFSAEQQDLKHQEWISHALEIVNKNGLSYTQHELSGWLTGPHDLLHSDGKKIEGAGPYPFSVVGELVFEDLQRYPPTRFR